ncbi:MAG: hypothetical protein JW928_03805 [Candidatus Aureabacteria bacterium]|nr:hypothetical protein [Candidatus Auribacterota bacterium]
MKRFSKIYSLSLAFLFLFFCDAYPSPCKVKGDPGGWTLEVDGKEFDLKGAGCGYATKDGTDYLALARDMGANCVRTWGFGQGTKEYLDAAHSYGLKVDAGIWFEHCYWRRKKKVFSYVNDVERVEQMERDTLEYVKRFKDHPAVIMWNLGNEALFFALEEEEKIAFCRFLERVAKKVKEIDPLHPVLYTASGTHAFPYLKKYVPSLDIIGVNTYGGIDGIQAAWKENGFSVPYMITELGPLGPWDCPKDEFGRSIDQADYEKAFRYQHLIEEAESFKGYCLGVFVFYLGATTQESLTWWNLTVGPYKRESFHVAKKFFTGKDEANKPPFCIGLELDKNIVFPEEEVKAFIKARDRENDSLTFDILVGTSKEDILLHKVNEVIPVKVLRKGEETVFLAPGQPGVYKLHAYVYDGNGNVSTRSVCFQVEESSK